MRACPKDQRRGTPNSATAAHTRSKRNDRPELHPRLESWIDHCRGVLRLKPTYVRRFYQDGGRLGLAKEAGGTYQPDSGLWVPERWIASTVTAANLHPIEGEGQSYLDMPGVPVSLKEALAALGPRLLGEPIYAACGPEFRVLSKILDPYEPIVFHIHARDADVRSYPQFFPGHRFGKDEAYCFLERPKGMVHYTHVGLWPGVTREELIRAVRKGRDYALELSPVINQRFEEGFFVPSGVPHRPGTALTLEIQQPSDVYTLLEDTAGGRKMAPEQIHPGFPDLDTAYQFIDMQAAQDTDILERYRGDEAFVSHPTATTPHRFTSTGAGGLEAFKFFPAAADGVIK